MTSTAGVELKSLLTNSSGLEPDRLNRWRVRTGMFDYAMSEGLEEKKCMDRCCDVLKAHYWLSEESSATIHSRRSMHKGGLALKCRNTFDDYITVDNLGTVKAKQ